MWLIFFRMEMQKFNTAHWKRYQVQMVSTVRWEFKNITTHLGEIDILFDCDTFDLPVLSLYVQYIIGFYTLFSAMDIHGRCNYPNRRRSFHLETLILPPDSRILWIVGVPVKVVLF